MDVVYRHELIRLSLKAVSLWWLIPLLHPSRAFAKFEAQDLISISKSVESRRAKRKAMESAMYVILALKMIKDNARRSLELLGGTLFMQR